MNRQEYLRRVRKEIYFIFDRDAIEIELNQHIEDSMADLREEGFSLEEAERLATEQMGDAREVGKMLNQEHKPLLGYLWMFSNVLLIIVAIPALFTLLTAGWGFAKMITPAVLENSTEVYPLAIELELPTHKLRLDNICANDEGNYCITYRTWTKYNYSRSGWTSQIFYLENSSGDYFSGGGFVSSSFIGHQGYTDFEWPEDNILYLVCSNGKTIVIDLKEYCDEKR